jgi:hypothetical protein
MAQKHSAFFKHAHQLSTFAIASIFKCELIGDSDGMTVLGASDPEQDL